MLHAQVETDITLTGQIFGYAFVIDANAASNDLRKLKKINEC